MIWSVNGRGAMRGICVPALTVFLLSACADVGLQQSAAPTRIAALNVTLNAEQARDMINKYRKRKGLKPLILHPKLAEAARRHSKDLSRHDTISHRGSDGSDPWERVKGTGYKARLAAENVGVGQVSLAEVFKGWQDSPGHNENLLLNDATHMGIALIQDPQTEYKTFWTLVLGSPI